LNGGKRLSIVVRRTVKFADPKHFIRRPATGEREVIVSAARPNKIPSTSLCKLCRSPAIRAFSLRVLGAFEGQYAQCAECGSLQVEDPHWTEKAYRGAFTDDDTGAVQRALYCQMVVSWLYTLLRLPRSMRLLDFGGGEGLLVRLLRDIGIDATFHDKFGSGAFARAFRDASESPAIVTSFEVWEHFVDPWAGMQQIFEWQPRYVFVSTVLYRGQGPEWWYLAPEHGQHVFFYTRQAMELIAKRFGYRCYVFKGCYVLFARDPLAGWQRWGVNLILTYKLRSFLLAAMPFYIGRNLDQPTTKTGRAPE